MNTAASPARGQPLVALGGIIAAWVVLRVMLVHYDAMIGNPAAARQRGYDPLSSQVATIAGSEEQMVSDRSPGNPALSRQAAPALAQRRSVRLASLAQGIDATRRSSSARRSASATPMALAAGGGNQILWMSALARVPLPQGLGLADADLAPFYPAGREPSSRGKRWSADGWVMVRRGGLSGLVAGSLPATYGASQAGAVLRYRLNPSSRIRPAAYLRVTSALDGVPDREVAAGLSARPVPRLPVVAAVELRAARQSRRTRLRPAAMLVTQIPPVDLPHSLRAEVYAQAGYVGGSYATGFADGQARLDTHVADLGAAQVRAGAGVWAGAQKGASRVDVGPTANVGMPLGQGASARLAIDWRTRISGNARPGSGPALTLSAGF